MHRPWSKVTERRQKSFEAKQMKNNKSEPISLGIYTIA